MLLLFASEMEEREYRRVWEALALTNTVHAYLIPSKIGWGVKTRVKCIPMAGNYGVQHPLKISFRDACRELTGVDESGSLVTNRLYVGGEVGS
jgi:hypothetical protein